MNTIRNILIISLVLILCIIISVLGVSTLYGTITRIEPQPVIVNGNQYQNAELAGFAAIMDRGYDNLVLLTKAPLQAIPELSSTFHEYLWNPLFLVTAVTACAIFGTIFCLCLLVIVLRNKAKREPQAV